MSTWRGSYAGYGLGCAAAWGVILAVGHQRLDVRGWQQLRLACGGWWAGWTSATIARIGYPAPKPLTAKAESRLRAASIGLVALGVAGTVRAFATNGVHVPG